MTLTNPSRRHCMVVHAYYPLGEIRVQREARALVDAGFEVDVICLRRPGEPARAEEDTVQIYRLPVQRYKQYGAAVQLLEYLAFFLLAAWQLLKLDLKRHYNTVQVHNLPDFLVFAALFPKLRGARVILDLHDLMPEFYAARFGGNMASFPVKLVKLQEKLACRFADHVLTVTEAWRRTLIERGVPAARCGVVMNLPDPRVFGGNGATPPGSSDGTVRLFYHGNVTQRYGLDLLVKAFARVYRQAPQARLTIHGRGDYQEEVRRLIDELGLAQVATLSTDLLPLEELPAMIRSADLAVVPYRYDVFTDGILPTKLMEYATLGIPTIATSSSAIRAYFDEEMVHFIPPDDVDRLAAAALELIAAAERRRQLGRNIARFNIAHSWPAEGRRYVELVVRLGDRTGTAQSTVLEGPELKPPG